MMTLENFSLPFNPANYDEIKTLIRPKLVNAKADINPAKIALPLIGDIKIMYSVYIGRGEDGLHTAMAVTKELLEAWGKTIAEIHAQAVANIPLDHYKIKGVSDILREMGFGGFPSDEPDPFYVMKSDLDYYSAAAILNPTLMKKAKRKMNGNFYIIPSSTNEILILNPDVDPAVVADMIKTVNTTEVADSEVLSNHLLAFDFDINFPIVVK